MSVINEVLTVWRRVFFNGRHIIIAIFSAFFFYFLNGFLFNIKNGVNTYATLGIDGSAKFLFFSSLFLANQVNKINAIGIVALSLLFGILISLLFFRFFRIDRSERKKVGFLGTIGIFLGFAAPTCVACGIGFLSFLGLSSALVVLPFNGNEVVFVSIFLVSLSIFSLSRKLYNPVCRLNSMAKKLKGGN